jgi:hypothetical protein
MNALVASIITTLEYRKPGNSRTLSHVLAFKFQLLFVFEFSSFKKIWIILIYTFVNDFAYRIA